MCILAMFSVDAFGSDWYQEWRSDQQQRKVKRHKHRHMRHNRKQRIVQTPTNSTDPVGAPLDGGLLAILAASGVTYYVAKKKKKKSSLEN